MNRLVVTRMALNLDGTVWSDTEGKKGNGWVQEGETRAKEEKALYDVCAFCE